jgi:hypothetical protein
MYALLAVAAFPILTLLLIALQRTEESLTESADRDSRTRR